jgi:hypothetical protein
MKTNVERSFELLDTLEVTDLQAEIERRMAEADARPVPAGPSPWRRAAVVVVALAVFAAAAVVAWEAFEGTRREREPATTPDPWSWASEGWTELPLPPEVRDGAAIVWTEDELVYWGGWPRGADVGRASADGFAFDPATRTWRTLPPASIAGGGPNTSRDERGGAKAVWTGSEILFWDVQAGDETGFATLAFDPATGVWRRLEDSPHQPSCCGAWAWTGRELIVFGGGDRDDPTTVQGAALDPATGTWRAIAESPIGMNLANAVWTGEEVIAVGSELDNRNIAETPTAIALGYDPEIDSWRRLPDPPLSPQASEALWFDDRLVAFDYNADSAQYVPAEDRWQGLGRQPLDHFECYVHGVAIDEAVLSWDCGYPDAWYPGTGWVDVEGGPAFDVPVDAIVGSQGRLVPAGSVAVVESVENVEEDGTVYIGSSDAPVHLWIWRPSSSPEPPPPTAEDAGRLVDRFILAWLVDETYLPTLGTQDVLDRCREGVGGCAQLAGGAFRNWDPGDVVETAPGTFEIQVELLAKDSPAGTLVFVVGPGTAADGGRVGLVVIDVRPG